MNITLTIRIAEILYEVDNATHLIARTAQEDEKTIVKASHLQSDTSPESRNQLLRSLQTALSALQTTLREWTSGTSVNAVSTLMTQEDIRIELILPDNYNTAGTEDLARLAHAYLMARTTAEWLILNNEPQTAKSYATDAQESVRLILVNIYSRIRPTRP